MAKRRTRKQKAKVKHTFLLSWEAKKNEPKANLVKGQFATKPNLPKAKTIIQKNANNLEKDNSLASVKHDIKKSLIIVSFILCFELVLYLAWNA